MSLEDAKYVCISVFTEMNQDNTLKKEDECEYLRICNNIVSSDIFEGLVVPPTFIHAAFYDKKRQRYVDENGALFRVHPFEPDSDFITPPEEITHRAYISMRFKSKITLSEVRKRFGSDYFNDKDESQIT